IAAGRTPLGKTIASLSHVGNWRTRRKLFRHFPIVAARIGGGAATPHPVFSWLLCARCRSLCCVFIEAASPSRGTAEEENTMLGPVTRNQLLLGAGFALLIAVLSASHIRAQPASAPPDFS